MSGNISQGGPGTGSSGSYAEGYIADGSLALGAISAPSPVIDFTLVRSRTIIFDIVTGETTVVVEGWYRISVGMSFSADKNATIHGEIIIDGTPAPNIIFERQISASGVPGNASCKGNVYLTANQVITFELFSSMLNTTVTINHFNLDIQGQRF